jgi:hypothetical protein
VLFGSLGMKNPKPQATTSTNPRTGIGAGRLSLNHGVRVRTKVRAGKLGANHGVRIRSV